MSIGSDDEANDVVSVGHRILPELRARMSSVHNQVSILEVLFQFVQGFALCHDFRTFQQLAHPEFVALPIDRC